MPVRCLSWIRELLIQLVESFKSQEKEFLIPHFPDDIIINILSRLPADDVVKYRRVCKLWQALTSTPFFAELHLKRVKPSLLVQVSHKQYVYSKDTDLHLLVSIGDGKYKRITKTNMDFVLSVVGCCPLLLGTCNGLLLFKATCWTFDHYVINPITKVKITVPPPAKKSGRAVGIFYDPLKRDYKLLYASDLNANGHHKYFICSIQIKKWRYIGFSIYEPRDDNPSSVTINGKLYWMTSYRFQLSCKGAIMVYDTCTEKLATFRHPGHRCGILDKERTHNGMFLMEVKEQLSLGKMMNGQIEIWVLKNCGDQEWILWHIVNLQQDNVTSVYMEDGEVIFGFSAIGLFCCHLRLEYTRVILYKEIGLPQGMNNFRGHAYAKSFIGFDELQNKA